MMRQSFSLTSFIAGIMLGALLAGIWFLDGSLIPTPAPPSSFIATSTMPASEESGAVAVADQPAGDTVIIESVTVPPPGVWLAVREMNGNDLGNVLGAERVVGPRSSVVVSLLRATEPNRRYVVQLYRDDANGIFAVGSNSVYVDFTTGTPVTAYFTTTE
jgi:hypothetical protein